MELNNPLKSQQKNQNAFKYGRELLFSFENTTHS